MVKKIAIIDLGTNTFHLLLCQIDDGGYHILHRDRVAVKIGMGGINDDHIPKPGMDRALQALLDFKKTIYAHDIHTIYAFGTSALRNARNGTEVVEEIKRVTGITVEIISGDKEAELIYGGVRSAVAIGEEKSMIIDIGGGSVECIIGDGETIFWKQSFEIGAQRLLERFQKHDPITPDEIESLEKHLEKNLTPLFDALEKYEPVTLVGSSGTFDTLSEIFCIRRNIAIADADAETPLTVAGFDEIHADLLTKNREQRMQIPGMIEMRVDMIVVASCLIRYVLKKYTFTRIRVSTYSLKEGVLASMVESGKSE